MKTQTLAQNSIRNLNLIILMRAMITNFYSGTSGVALPVPKSQYPPGFQHKSRLQYYASLFNTVEVNSIFYKLPRASTVVNWRESVPDDFRFTFKVSKTITHVKDLNFNQADVNNFVQTVTHIGDKKGCLLTQFPPSLKINKLDRLQQLAETLAEATHDAGWGIAMEFRDASWYEREVYEILNEYNITLVRHDIATSATPPGVQVGGFIYLRFHGPEPRYRGTYDDTFLTRQANYISDQLEQGRQVYAYFNNTLGDAVKNLQTLNEMVR